MTGPHIELSMADQARIETLKAIGKVLLGEVSRINSREAREDVLITFVAAAGKLDATERAPFKFSLGDVVASAYNFKADRMGVVAARGEVVDMTGNSYLVLIDNGANVWFAEDDIQPVKKDDRNVGDVTVTITTGEDLGECKNCPNCQNPGMCAKPNVETEQTEQTKFVMGQSVMVRESLLAGRIQGIYPIQPGDKERAYTVVGKDKNGGLVYMRFYESELTPNVETERYKFEIGQPVMTPRIAGRIHAIHPVMHGDSERRYTVSGKDGHDTAVYMQFFESDIQPI